MPFIHANGIEIYYEESGSGEPVVLVHGSWSDHHNWALVAPELARNHRVVTYDRRGHSQTERPVDVRSRRQDEDDLGALIEQIDCVPAHLVGTSFGGATVLGLASRRPELVRSVSVHEPPLISLVAEDESLAPLVQQTGASLVRVVSQLQKGDVEGGARRFMEEVALGPGGWELLPESLRETAVANAPAFLGEAMDPEGFVIDPEALQELPFALQLTQGTDSPEWLRSIVAELAQIADDATVHTFIGAGHAPHLTSPADFVTVVSDFIAQSARSSVVIGAGV